MQILNSEDDGTRKFILCTNNENGIAENVTYKRLRAVGKKTSGYEEITGLDFSLDYYKIHTMVKSENYDQKILDFSEVITPFIQINEQVYDEIVAKIKYQIYRSQEKCIGIYISLDPSEIEEFKANLLLQPGELIAYIATLDGQGLQNFDLYGWDGVIVKTLPIEIISRMEANSGY